MSLSVFERKETNEGFARDGCVVGELLTRLDLDSLTDAYRRLARPQTAGFDSTILSHDRQYREAVDRAIRSRIAPAVSSVLTGYRVAFCTFVVKAANDRESAVPLHQDWSFLDEERFTSIGVWCPLVDVDFDNGCLQVVKGSHAFPHPPRAACTPFAYPELVPYLRAEYLAAVPMRAGQALLFDGRLFHCSPPNRSGAERVAATAVLAPVEAPLRYYHMIDPREPHWIEVFEVEDGFYLSHAAGRRPTHATRLGVVDVRDWALDRTGAAPPPPAQEAT